MKTKLSLAELLKGTDTSLRMALILEEVRVLDSDNLDDKKTLMGLKIREITEAIKGEADLIFTPGFEYFMDSLHNLLLNCDNRSVAEPGRKGKSGTLYQKVIDTPEYQIVHSIKKISYKDNSETYAQNAEAIESEKLVSKVYKIIDKDATAESDPKVGVNQKGKVIVGNDFQPIGIVSEDNSNDDVLEYLDELISGMNQ